MQYWFYMDQQVRFNWLHSLLTNCYQGKVFWVDYHDFSKIYLIVWHTSAENVGPKSENLSIVFRPKMIVVNCYGRPKKCPQKWLGDFFYKFLKIDKMDFKPECYYSFIFTEVSGHVPLTLTRAQPWTHLGGLTAPPRPHLKPISPNIFWMRHWMCSK